MIGNANQTKVLIIGLEGASLDAIQKITRKNQLPFLQKVIDTASFGNLKSTLPLNGAASWASFFTGKNPGKHSIYDFVKPNGSLLQPKIIDNDSIQSDLMWHISDRHSLKSIFFNIPIVTKPEKVNGIMVSGFATLKDQPFAYPLSIHQELLEQEFKFNTEPYWHFRHDEYFNEILRTFEKQTNSFLQLINHHSWNLAMVTFSALDKTQQRYGDDPLKIELFYSTFDAYLQRLFEAIDENTYFVLVSNLGFKKVTKKFFVNEWLWEAGFLDRKITTKQTRRTDIDEILFNANGDRDQLITKVLTKSGITKKTIRKVIPESPREKLKQVLPLSIKKILNREYLEIKWAKTQAYFISENVQGININLKDREPFGIVESGDQFEKLRDKIISELYHFKDPHTFEHVVEEVYRKEDLFHGDNLESAPDIIIVPYANTYFLDSNKRTSRQVIGSATDEYPVYGARDRNGVFFITGPDIKQGEQIADVSILDMAPTIFYLFGIHEKDGMDGKVRTDIFAESED